MLDFLSVGGNVPRWAPDLTSRLDKAGEHRRAASGVLLDLIVHRESGTVDLVAAAAHSRGAFKRVLGDGDGSQLSITLCFPTQDEQAVQRQRTVLDADLDRIRLYTEAGGRAG